MSLDAARRLLATTTDQVRDRYGPEIGRPVADLVTPALVLDIEVADRNIARMGAAMAELPASLRPHIKVHKSPQLAQRQVEAGAIGLSCATVWEALILAAAGLDDLFLVNTRDHARQAGRPRDARRVSGGCWWPSTTSTRRGCWMRQPAGRARTLGVVIEVDTGMERAGVVSLEAAVALARELAPLRHLGLEGVTGYEGHCSLTPERDERARKQAQAMGYLVEVAEAIRADGVPLPIVSAAGTATWEWTASFPGVTESQAGSYVLMDTFHGAMVPEFDQALTVATTVISRPPGRLIVDAGSKSLGDAMGATMRGSDRAVIRFDEEHGIFASDEHDPALGDVVQLVPGYAPSTVNWYDAYHVVQRRRGRRHLARDPPGTGPPWTCRSPLRDPTARR